MQSSTETLAVHIKPVTDPLEIFTVEHLQRDVWGMADVEIVPQNMLVTFVKNGGLILGAYDEAERMIGFVFGFVGIHRVGSPEERYKHCSHMAGVLPEYRSSGIGEQLKRAQRERIIRQGFDLASWTYDPLEGLNAQLNIGKLGAVSRTYLRNVYGEMSDVLNRGLPTDRFEVEWWVTSPWVENRLAGARSPASLIAAEARGYHVVTRTITDPNGVQRLESFDLSGAPERILVEVPAHFQAIKAADMGVAREWRLGTRELFEVAFGQGYTAVDFISDTTTQYRRNFYGLQQGFDPNTTTDSWLDSAAREGYPPGGE